MALAAKKYTIIEVEYNELEALIKEHFGHEFSLVAEFEITRDGVKKIEIDGVVEDDDIPKIERFKAEGRGNWLALALLNQLAADGLIETGTYLITT